MPRKRNATLPDSHSLVSPERQRLAVRLLREADEEGLTKEEMARRMGGVTTRTVDRTMEVLERQGARIDRLRRTFDGRSLLTFHLRKGPRWDEQLSSLASAVLGLAFLPAAEQGNAQWHELLGRFQQAVDEQLTSRDRVLLGQILAERPKAKAGVQVLPTPTEVLLAALSGAEGPREVELEVGGAGRRSRNQLVVPLRLQARGEEGPALVAWDPGSAEEIEFALDEVQTATLTGRPGRLPEAQDSVGAMRRRRPGTARRAGGAKALRS